MPIIDSMKNDAAVVLKLIDQIDARIGKVDAREPSTENSSFTNALINIRTEDEVKFLKHIRLVLGGPIEDEPVTANIIPIRKVSAS